MAKMERAVGPLICLFIMVMDIAAGILGIEAEIAQNKGKYIKVWFLECREPSYEAYKLGLAAAVLLALAHAIMNTLGGCVCMWSKEELDRSSTNKQLAAGSLIFSWIILIIAFSMLIIGTVTNSRSRTTCGFSHRYVLAIGGILCFIHGLLSVAYYVSATAFFAEEERMVNQQQRPPA
ncbi:Protein DESIGUAL 2 [Ancistrocladus abbreviatus]